MTRMPLIPVTPARICAPPALRPIRLLPVWWIPCCTEASNISSVTLSVADMLTGPMRAEVPQSLGFDGFCLFMARRRHPVRLTRQLHPPCLRHVGGGVSHPAGAVSARDDSTHHSWRTESTM